MKWLALALLGIGFVLICFDPMVRRSGRCPHCGYYCTKRTAFCPEYPNWYDEEKGRYLTDEERDKL